MKVKIIEYTFKEGDTITGVIKGKSIVKLNDEQINKLVMKMLELNEKDNFKMGDKVLLPIIIED